ITTGGGSGAATGAGAGEPAASAGSGEGADSACAGGVSIPAASSIISFCEHAAVIITTMVKNTADIKYLRFFLQLIIKPPSLRLNRDIHTTIQDKSGSILQFIISRTPGPPELQQYLHRNDICHNKSAPMLFYHYDIYRNTDPE